MSLNIYVMEMVTAWRKCHSLSVGAGVIFQLHFMDVPSCKEWVSRVAIQHVSILPLISDLNGVLLHTAR